MSQSFAPSRTLQWLSEVKSYVECRSHRAPGDEALGWSTCGSTRIRSACRDTHRQKRSPADYEKTPDPHETRTIASSIFQLQVREQKQEVSVWVNWTAHSKQQKKRSYTTFSHLPHSLNQVTGLNRWPKGLGVVEHFLQLVCDENLHH